MGLHTETRIYRDAYGLLGVATDYVKNMPRSVKPIFGAGICDRCLELVLLIVDTNALPKESRAPVLDEILRRVTTLEVLMRLCRDKRYISPDQYAKAVAFTTSVGRQANGWKKWSQKKDE
jgi:hypothetical protein